MAETPGGSVYESRTGKAGRVPNFAIMALTTLIL